MENEKTKGDAAIIKKQLDNSADRKNEAMLSKTGSSQEPVCENWAEQTIADLDDFIESQGIYIRQ